MNIRHILISCSIALVIFVTCWVIIYLTDPYRTQPLVDADSTEESLLIISPPKEISDTIFEVNSSGELTFYEDGKVIGELKRLEDGTFTFTGQADASAQRFFEVWEGMFREHLSAICGQEEMQ